MANRIVPLLVGIAVALVLSIAGSSAAGAPNVAGQVPLPTVSPTEDVPVLVECSDLVDNDGDSEVDFNGDDGCMSLLDEEEGGPSPLCGTPNVVCGGPADNEFKGDAGANIFFGGGGDDHIRGGGGADKLYGGPGSDLLQGQRGPDVVRGGPGDDTCSGGVGKDEYDRCETISNP